VEIVTNKSFWNQNDKTAHLVLQTYCPKEYQEYLKLIRKQESEKVHIVNEVIYPLYQQINQLLIQEYPKYYQQLSTRQARKNKSPPSTFKRKNKSRTTTGLKTKKNK